MLHLIPAARVLNRRQSFALHWKNNWNTRTWGHIGYDAATSFSLVPVIGHIHGLSFLVLTGSVVDGRRWREGVLPLGGLGRRSTCVVITASSAVFLVSRWRRVVPCAAVCCVACGHGRRWLATVGVLLLLVVAAAAAFTTSILSALSTRVVSFSSSAAVTTSVVAAARRRWGWSASVVASVVVVSRSTSAWRWRSRAPATAWRWWWRATLAGSCLEAPIGRWCVLRGNRVPKSASVSLVVCTFTLTHAPLQIEGKLRDLRISHRASRHGQPEGAEAECEPQRPFALAAVAHPTHSCVTGVFVLDKGISESMFRTQIRSSCVDVHVCVCVRECGIRCEHVDSCRVVEEEEEPLRVASYRNASYRIVSGQVASSRRMEERQKTVGTSSR